MTIESSELKKIIDDMGFRYGYVAEKLGVSRQTLNNWFKENKPEQIEKVKMAIRKSQIGDGNHYNDVNKDLVKVLRELVQSQKASLESQRATMQMQQQSLVEKNAIIEGLRKDLEGMYQDKELLQQEINKWLKKYEECEHRLKGKKKD